MWSTLVYPTKCPKTAAEAPPVGSVPHPLVVVMTTEAVATAAGAMMIGTIGIVHVTMTEETTTVHVMTTGETMTVLATTTGGTRGPCTMIALGYHPLTPQVCFPSKLTTSAMKLVRMNFVQFLPSSEKLATFTRLSIAPLVVAAVSVSSVSPKKRTPRKLARKWTGLAYVAANSVLFLRGTRDRWMSEHPQPPVVLHPGAVAAPLAAIDLVRAPMKQVTVNIVPNIHIAMIFMLVVL